jgi:cell division protease FtsH
VTVYGMSKQLGPMAFDRSANQFLGGWGNPRRPLSSQVEATIDRGIKHLIDQAHQIAYAILAHNQPLLREMAQVLLEQEILEGQQLHSYLSQVQTPPVLDHWLLTGEVVIERSSDPQVDARENGLPAEHFYAYSR